MNGLKNKTLRLSKVMLSILIALTSFHLTAFSIHAASGSTGTPSFNPVPLVVGSNIHMNGNKYQAINGNTLLASSSNVANAKGEETGNALANDKALRAFSTYENTAISDYGLPSDAHLNLITANPNLFDKSVNGFWGTSTKNQQYINTVTRKFLNSNNGYASETYNYQGRWPNSGELYSETMDNGYAINGDITTTPIYKDWIYQTRDQSKLVSMNQNISILWSPDYGDYTPGLGGPSANVSHTELFADARRNGTTINDPNGRAYVNNRRYGIYDATKDAIRNLSVGEEIPVGSITGMVLNRNQYLSGWTAPGFRRITNTGLPGEYIESWVVSFDKSHTFKVGQQVGTFDISGYQIATADQNGQVVVAPKKSIRPSFRIDTNKIAYTMPSSEDNRYTISPTLSGGVPNSMTASGDDFKLSLKDASSSISSVDVNNLVGGEYDENNKILYVPKGSTEITIPFETTGANNYISALSYDKNDVGKFGKIGNVVNHQSKAVIDLSTLIDTNVLGSSREIAFYTEQANGANQSNTISSTPMNITVRVVESQEIDFTDDTKNLMATTIYKYGDSFTLHAEVTKASSAGDPLDQPISFGFSSDYFTQIGSTSWDSLTGKASATFEVIKPIPAGTDSKITINKAATLAANGNIAVTSAIEKEISISTRKRKIKLSADPQSYSYGNVLPRLPYTIMSDEPGEDAIVHADHIPYKVATTHLVGLLGQNAIPVDSSGNILVSASGNIWRLDIIADGLTSSFDDRYEITDKLSALLDVSDEKGENAMNQEKVIADNFDMSVSDYVHMKDDEAVLKNTLKQKAKVRAISTFDNTEISIDTIKHNLRPKAGLYSVSFATTKNTQAVVQAKLWDYVHEDTLTGEKVTGNNIHISVAEAASLKGLDTIVNTKLKQLGGLKAIRLDTGKEVTLSLNGNDIADKRGSYDVTFETASGTSLKVKAYVYDNSKEDAATNERIVANDVYISRAEAARLIGTDVAVSDELVKLSGVNAKDMTTHDVLNVHVKSNTIEAKKGTFEVVFTTNKGTEVTVTAYVSDYTTEDTTTNERMSGNDIRISKAEAQNLVGTSDAVLKRLVKLGSIHAYRLDDGKVVDVLIVKNDIQAVKGMYLVQFSTAKGTALTIQVYVSDEATEDLNNQERITANHIYISSEEAKNLKGIETTVSDQLVVLGQVNAYDLDTNSKVAVHAKSNTIEAKKGTYEVVFTTNKGTEVTVTAYVSDYATEDITKKERIVANDIYISTEDAKYLMGLSVISTSKLISLAGAQAYSLETGGALQVFVQENKIKNDKGSYQVNFATALGTSVSIRAFVKDNEAIDKDKKEKILANNFRVSLAEAEHLIGLSTEVESRLIILSSVSAFEMIQGNKLAVSLKANEIKAKKGAYDVIFKTNHALEVTAKGYVTDAGNEDVKNNERITANNIYISSKEAELLKGIDTDTSLSLIMRADVRAYSTLTDIAVDILVSENNINEKKGSYDVTFITVKGTAVTIQAIVFDYAQEDSENKERIAGKDIYLSIQEASHLLGVGEVTSDQLVTLTGAKAYSTSTGEALSIKVIKNTLQAEKGIYELTLATEKGTRVTIKAYVRDDEKSEEVINHEKILGNNIQISLQEAVSLIGNDKTVSDKLVSLGFVQALELEYGNQVDVKVIRNQIVAEKGIYSVTFATEKGTTITLKATVKDNGASDHTTKEKMVGNDISVDLKEYDRFVNKDMILKLSDVTASNLETGKNVMNIQVDYSGIQRNIGVYQVYFKTEAGTDLIINATVTDKFKTLSNRNYFDHVSVKSIFDQKGNGSNTRKVGKDHYQITGGKGVDDCFSHFYMILLTVLYVVYAVVRVKLNKKSSGNMS